MNDKRLTIKAIIKQGILDSIPSDRILKIIYENFPNAVTDERQIKMFSSAMKREGIIDDVHHAQYLAKPRNAVREKLEKMKKVKKVRTKKQEMKRFLDAIDQGHKKFSKN